MFEVLDPQIIPEVASFAGLALGAYAEHRAVEKAGERQRPVQEAWFDEPEGQPAAPETPGRLALAGRKIGQLVTILSVSTGVTLGLTAEAWLPLSQQVKRSGLGALEVVVDRSGATALNVDGPAPLPEINNLVSHLENVDGLKTEAVVANLGTQINEMKLSAVKNVQAAGNAQLDQAVSIALDRAGLDLANKQTNNSQRGAGVLVITNGNGIGSTGAVVGEAKQQGNIPVFVANVEGGLGATSQSLQTIARQTGAQYWGARETNINSVAGAIKHIVTPASHEVATQVGECDTRNNAWLKVLSLASIFGVGMGYKQRGKSPLRRNSRGE